MCWKSKHEEEVAMQAVLSSANVYMVHKKLFTVYYVQKISIHCLVYEHKIIILSVKVAFAAKYDTFPYTNFFSSPADASRTSDAL